MVEQSIHQRGETRRTHLAAAYDIAAGLIAGTTDMAKVAENISARSKPCLDGRLQAMAAQWSEISADANIVRLAKIIDRMAENDDGGLLAFSAFQKKIEADVAGIVFTAHPTFSLSAEAWTYAKSHLAALGRGEGTRAATAGLPLGSVQPTVSPSLYDELDYAEHAVLNVRYAIRQLYTVIFDRSAALYPMEYRNLRPTLATVASWVGFDLDGRTDIDWSTGLTFRYRLALAGLGECLKACETLKFENSEAQGHAAAITAGFEELKACFELGASTLQAHKDSPAGLGKLNQLAVQNRSVKEAATGRISAAFDALLALDLPHTAWRQAATLQTEWRTVGLGLSHIHFRLNSAQLHNAISHEIQLVSAPDESAQRRTYLAAVSEKLDSVKAKNIHYGTLSVEQTTARRVFMMAAQFQKHFDSATRIRVLVAESDTPFTLLTALYYAKLFGVEDHVEISPLFETAIGLERGDRVIAELLDNVHFLDYVKGQGRFAIQLGFSDSGRYIGQPAATLAIERFKLRVANLWRKRGLGDTQLLFFDTHGESVGRGAYPESLKKRFLYTHSPRVRERLATLARPEKHEISFQGGEGFMWFMTGETALATLTDFLEVRLAAHSSAGDKLYTEKGWSLDFFLTLVDYQNELTDHKGYIRLIDGIGRSLLYPTGSRSLRRQGGSALHQRLERVSQIRAIPHNAVLQQLGYLANSCGGLGTAIGRAPEKFNTVHSGSERLRMVVGMALAALARSDVGVIEAYAKLLSPTYWLDRCDDAHTNEGRDALRRLSGLMEDLFESDAVDSCIRKLRFDASLLADCLSEDCDTSALGTAAVDDELLELHQIRIGLIQFIFMKAMQVPRFSTRFDFSLEDLLVELLHLEVPDTLKALRKIFPEAPIASQDETYGEESSYQSGSSAGYGDVHRQIFDPIEEAYRLVLELSGLIALKTGAFG